MDTLHLKKVFDQYCKFITNKTDITETYCGLVKGNMGLILCYSCFYQHFNDSDYLNKTQIIMNKIFTKRYRNYSLGYGLAGLAWTIELLKQAELFECKWGWTEKIDILLAEECQKQILNARFDYFSGSAGILNYFLSKQVYGEIVFDLAHSYVNEISKKLTITPHNYNLNLGVPHGLIGDALLLLKLKEKLHLQVDQLIVKIISLLWESRNPIKSTSILPYFQNNKKDTTLAWCYGDLPLMYCLTKMRACDISFDYPKGMDLVFELTPNRTDCFKNNNTLCHGSIVVALLYFQIWKITGSEKYLCISKDWKKYSYEVWDKCYSDFTKSGEYADFYLNFSLFNGSPGFFLSMLSMENVNQMKWEQCLII